MSIISFDVGIKNMSYCMFSPTSLTIEQWDIIDLTRNANVDTSDLESCTQSLLEQLHERFGSETNITHVVIENQPCLKNPTMKSIQMILYTYFAYNRHVACTHPKINMHLYNAANKTKLHKLAIENIQLKEKFAELFSSTPSTYSARKKVSIECVEYLLTNDNHIKMSANLVTRFQKSKKKDDLADALLQGLHFALSIKICAL